MGEVKCFCCDKWLSVEFFDSNNPLTINPVYDGLIFRTTGNFGSKIFDPMPIGVEEFLQVVVCDDCIKNKAKWVTRIHNIQRNTTSEAGEFNPN